jgi:hypothetical protein
MEQDQSQNLEENLPMVNYIMLHRIYDMLALIASKLANEEDVDKLLKMHEEGYLFGPPPAYTSSEDSNE